MLQSRKTQSQHFFPTCHPFILPRKRASGAARLTKSPRNSRGLNLDPLVRYLEGSDLIQPPNMRSISSIFPMTDSAGFSSSWDQSISQNSSRFGAKGTSTAPKARNSIAQLNGLGFRSKKNPACRAGIAVTPHPSSASAPRAIPNPKHTVHRRQSDSAQESGGIPPEKRLPCDALPDFRCRR